MTTELRLELAAGTPEIAVLSDVNAPKPNG